MIEHRVSDDRRRIVSDHHVDYLRHRAAGGELLQEPDPRPLAVPVIPPAELRRQAYASHPLVELAPGVLVPCDDALRVLEAYREEEKLDQVAEIKASWLAARAKIREAYLG